MNSTALPAQVLTGIRRALMLRHRNIEWKYMGMGIIASPTNSFIMRYVPMENVGSIGGMIALTRNAGMFLGAALGLGAINGDIEESAPLLGALKSVFGLGVMICMARL